MPLYAGNDLEDTRATLVSEHLRSCAECSLSADEYRETMQMFGQFTPPPFDETVYAGIRQYVLHEIEQESAGPTLRQLVANLLGQRLTWAVAASLMLAVCAFTIYFLATRTSRPQVADNHTIDRSEQPEMIATPGPQIDITGKNKDVKTTTAASIGRKYLPQRKNLAAVPNRVNSLRHAADKRPKIDAAFPAANNLAVFPARDPAATDLTLRVEMQTKDPNIRIIWFSNQPAKQNSRN